jgi:flagellar export protein FliJ
VKKFNFSLAPVENWSQQQLSAEQMSLARLVQQVAQLDERLRQLRQEATDNQTKLQMQAVMTGYEIEALTRFVEKLAQERRDLQRVRTKLSAKLEEQRQRVVVGNRKVKLFKNLHDRRLEEWKQDLGKEEAALTSDLFLAAVARDLNRQTSA